MSTHAARTPARGHPPPVDRSSTLPCRRLSVRRVTVRRIVAANRQGDVDVTSIETGPSWVERLNPRHWTLVWKLVIVGLVPALLALALGVLRIADQAGSAADLGRGGRLLEARTRDRRRRRRAAPGARPGHLLRREQRQRRPRRRSTRSRQRSDEALKAMRDSLACATRPTSSPSTQAALQRTPGFARPDPVLRQTRHDPPSVPYDQVVNRYTASSADRRAGSRDPAPAAHPGHGGSRRRSSAVFGRARAALDPARGPRGRHPGGQAAARRPRGRQRGHRTARHQLPRLPGRDHPGAAGRVRRPPRHVGHQPHGPAAFGHPLGAVPAQPAGQGVGRGLRPGAREHRSHRGR